MPANLWADPVGYAILTDENEDGTKETLKFMYGEMPSGDCVWETTNTGTNNPGWFDYHSNITSVVFDPSFANALPTSCYSWFSNMSNIQSIDLTNLNTSEVTSMENMFSGCINLVTIKVNHALWNLGKVTSSTDMFKDCSSIVGIDGTTYDDAHTDKEYATSNLESPSYLFVLYNYYIAEYDSSTLTFKGVDTSPTGSNPWWDTTDTGSNYPGWKNKNSFCNYIVIDKTFAGAQPVSCYAWFYEFKYVKGITDLKYLNTGNVTNMASMFYGCTKLKSLDLGSFNTVNVTNMKNMFTLCQELTDITFGSNFCTTNVTDMEGMFYWCTGLTSLDLRGFNTSRCTTMKQMFCKCETLSSLSLSSSFNTSNVTNMYQMFYNCKGLTSLEVAGFNTENVTDMSNMFWYCSGLTSLDVSRFNTSKVTTMYGLFCGCQSLTSLNLSNFNTSNVTNMLQMFSYCKELTSLDLASFNTSKVTSMRLMFSGCKKITSLDLTGFNTETVKDMGDMFQSCEKLETISFGNNFNTGKVTDMEELFYGCKALSSIDLSQFNTSNVTTMYRMFRDCIGLTSFNMNLNTSNVTNMSELFYGCTNLETISFGNNFDTENVTNMSGLFYGCRSLSSIDLSRFNTSKVTTMSEMFHDCSGFISFNMNLNTSNVTSMYGLFWGCTNLETISFGNNFNTSKVTRTSYMFASCSNLTTILTNDWGDLSLITEHTQMFYGCTRLVGGKGTIYNSSYQDKTYARIDGGPGSETPGYFTKAYAYFLAEYDGANTLTFKGSDTEANGSNQWSITSASIASAPGWNNHKASITNVIIEGTFMLARPNTCYSWFSGMTNLTSSNITGLSYLNTNEVQNMSRMFEGCSELTSLDLSNFETGNVTDMSEMFNLCSGLTSLTLGSSFSTEGLSNESDEDIADMFSGCSALETITIKGNTVPVIGKDIFASKANPSIYQLLQVNGTNTTMLDDQVDTSDGYINWKGGKFTSLNDKIKRPDISVAMTDWTYDGQTSTHTPTLSGTNASDAASVVYTYAVAGNDTYGSDVPHNVGSYTVKATVPAFVKSNVSYLAMNAVGDFSISAADLADATVDGGASLTVDYGQSTAIGALTVNYPNADYVVVYRKADVDATSIPAESIGLYSVVLKPSDTGNLTGEKVTGYTVNVQLPVVFKLCEWVTYYDERFNLATPAGYQTYKVTGASSSGVTAEAIDYIPMGVPVILHTNQSGTSSESMTIRLNEQTSTSEVSGDAAFVGIPSTATTGVTPSGTAYILVGDQFVLYEGSAAIPAHRCFLSLTSEARKRSLGIDFGDGTTSLRELEGSEEWKEKREMWYTLDGRKLNAIPQKKGLYVRNGQKVVVK